MEAEKIALNLDESEKKILTAVSSRPMDSAYLIDKIGLDRDSVMNASRRLLSKGLVRVLTSVSVDFKLTDLGRKYAADGLPERVLLSYISTNKQADYKQLTESVPLTKEEFSAAIGSLKKIKAISIDGSAVKIDKEKPKELEEKEESMEKAMKGLNLDENEIVSELIKRGIIEKKEKFSETVEITDLGKEVMKTKGFSLRPVDKLSPEIIYNWKDAVFKGYNLDMDIPMPLSGKKNITKQFASMIKEILVSMGFKEMRSDYAESSFWNFDVMMFKQDHPDRDIQDTVHIGAGETKVPTELLERVKGVYEAGFKSSTTDSSIGFRRDFDISESKKLIMRGHTTATTFRYIYNEISKHKDLPAKFFSVDKAFRNETMDFSHLPELYQIEGVVYDDDLNLSDLVSYIKEFYSRIGLDKIRLKPTYNPYTEPSLEIQAFSKGLDRWIEVGNSGIFRPETLRPFGIEKNIIAWGFGMERILISMLGVSDIRQIYGAFSDLDFLRNVPESKILRGSS